MKHLQTFESDNDGRYLSTAGLAQELLRKAPLKLAYDSTMSREDFSKWRRRTRRKLCELLQFPDPTGQPEPRCISVDERDGYTLEKWHVYPEPGAVVPLLLLKPDGVSERRPAAAVMVIPGSSGSKELMAAEPEPDGKPTTNRWPERNKMAWYCAKQGLVAVAVDNPTGGELHDELCPDRAEISRHLAWLGRSYEGLSVFHKWVVLQWMKTLDYVNPRRIVACGLSLGAKPALLLGVLDRQVKGVVWNDFVSDWRVRQVVTNLGRIPGWQIIPGLWQWFDYVDLLASLAPRPLLITEGGYTPDIDRIRHAYHSLDADDKCQVHYYDRYADQAAREFDREEIPTGISDEDYLLYANVDVPQHSFKPDKIRPWLQQLVGGQLGDHDNR
ncbi:MAG: alpha/beta hydrolase family protein [Planctomycetota bacterium]|jgi:hypothetical protein|nr:alpha/beta hydrolase family protein [Planctomycetota bacterium]MDP7131925.1 alpha/beta hydrolase family protein [Planctomycetota bacterium]MDP7249934.1 alpha/beta hydrolase family protein [Planctomycetota bacterium]